MRSSPVTLTCEYLGNVRSSAGLGSELQIKDLHLTWNPASGGTYLRWGLKPACPSWTFLNIPKLKRILRVLPR